MASRLLLAAVLLSVCAVGAMAGTCPVCIAFGTICLTSTINTANVPALATVNTCPQALGLISCGTCSSGGACPCTAACVNGGTGSALTLSCTCGAPGVCADPHFTGAFGVHYDFHGLPDRDFNLITDQGLAVNAHFIGQDGLETGFDGTWMSALGLVWTEGTVVRTATVTVKEGADAFDDAVPFEIEIDGQVLAAPSFQAMNQEGQDEILYKDESLSIAASSLAYTRVVTIKDHLTMTVTAATHDEPSGNHIDIGISKLNVTATVHGALGQTFAAARADTMKAAASVAGTLQIEGADIVEGKDVDYMTSSLLSTDFTFNRFNPYSGVLAKLNVLARKLLGHDSNLAKQDLQGDLSCISLESGGIRCFN